MGIQIRARIGHSRAQIHQTFPESLLPSDTSQEQENAWEEK